MLTRQTQVEGAFWPSPEARPFAGRLAHWHARSWRPIQSSVWFNAGSAPKFRENRYRRRRM